jgi:hypothetical protein
MTAGRIARELWSTNQEFHPIDIIPTWFSMVRVLQQWFLFTLTSSVSRLLDLSHFPYKQAVVIIKIFPMPLVM